MTLAFVDTGGFFETLFLFLIPLAIVTAWVFALIDLFQNRRLSGGGKAGWLFVIVVFPLLGSLIYLAAREDP